MYFPINEEAQQNVGAVNVRIMVKGWTTISASFIVPYQLKIRFISRLKSMDGGTFHILFHSCNFGVNSNSDPNFRNFEFFWIFPNFYEFFRIFEFSGPNWDPKSTIEKMSFLLCMSRWHAECTLLRIMWLLTEHFILCW